MPLVSGRVIPLRVLVGNSGDMKPFFFVVSGGGILPRSLTLASEKLPSKESSFFCNHHCSEAM